MLTRKEIYVLRDNMSPSHNHFSVEKQNLFNILSVRLQGVIQKDGLNFIVYISHSYISWTYTWYVNDLHNIWKRRS